MSTRPELWLLLYTLSGFVILLLGISTGFSFIGYLLWPWLDRQEHSLHVLPTEQYLTIFAWPVAAAVVFPVITGLGVAWLMSGGLTLFTGIAVLVVGTAGGIYAGLLAVRQLIKTRRNDPVKLAHHDNPASMRWASVELTRRVTALKADVPTADTERLRRAHRELYTLHDRLVDSLKKLQRREPGKHLVARSRELAGRYTWWVSLGALAATVLAVVATPLAVVAGQNLLRAVGLGAFLAVSAVGLWWTGMLLRTKTHFARTDALSEHLTAEFNWVRHRLDEVDQHIRDEVSRRAARRTPRPAPLLWPLSMRPLRWIRQLLGDFCGPRR